MDILYILGGGSRHDNIELKWSLRSVEKFGKNVGKIVVAGVIPEWLSDEVVKIPVEQKSPLYSKNNWANVMAAVESGAVNGKFMLSADDHFYVKPIDFEAMPLLVAGFLPDKMDYRANNEYFLGLYYSRKILEASGLPFYNCSLHNNVLCDTEAIVLHTNIAAKCAHPTYRMNPWAILGNLYLAVRPEARIAVRDDIKICEEMRAVGDIEKRIGASPMFSIGDAAFNGGALEGYMNGLFGEKSRFEK